MSQSPPPPPCNVLIPIYEGVNTLDVNGPLEVLCNYALREGSNSPPPFNITITAACTSVQAYEFIKLQPDCTFEDVIPRIEAGEFDIMVVPGAGPGYIEKILAQITENRTKAVAHQTTIIDVIQTFMRSDNKSSSEKWLVSICVGAKLMGAAGAFRNLNATTHWAALGSLADVCKEFKAIPKSITRQRWVDGGNMAAEAPAKKPTHVVSSGGISCGIDCTLWLVEQILGPVKAVSVAMIMDYKWTSVYMSTPNPYPYGPATD